MKSSTIRPPHPNNALDIARHVQAVGSARGSERQKLEAAARQLGIAASRDDCELASQVERALVERGVV